MWLYGYITWCGTKSLDSHHKITPIYINICPLIISVEKEMKPVEKSQPKSFTFSCLLLKMKEEWTHFVDSKGSDKQKLKSIAAPDSTKKSTKFCCQQALQKVIGGL